MEDSVIINQIAFRLDDVYNDCWHQLMRGAASAKHAFHCPAIATVANGCPEIRTVVLRKAIFSDRSLLFHTDFRSPKLKQLRENNTVTWLFYDQQSRIQLRIKSVATIHHQDEVTLNRWQESRVESKKCYLVDPAPSSIVPAPTDGLPVLPANGDLTESEVETGYENFAVVWNEVQEIDWLFLSRHGHRRARFILGKEGVEQFWVVP